MVNILKGLGDENRLRIVHLLSLQSLCVCEIETLLDMKQSNVSRHLNKLKSSSIIESDKDGQWVHYDLSDDFKRRYSHLLEDLTTFFSTDQVFIKDRSAYDTYIDLGYTCSDIRKDEDLVKLQVRGENNE
jgi:ArsR family transcriptional regulator